MDIGSYSLWAEFAESGTAAFLYNAVVMVMIVVVGTIVGSLVAIFLIENLSTYAKEMKRWLKLNGNGLA